MGFRIVTVSSVEATANKFGEGNLLPLVLWYMEHKPVFDLQRVYFRHLDFLKGISCVSESRTRLIGVFFC